MGLRAYLRERRRLKVQRIYERQQRARERGHDPHDHTATDSARLSAQTRTWFGGGGPG